VTARAPLHHTRRGSGTPLLLVQGLSATHLYWGDELLELLERDFDVVTYDHRGVAESPSRGAGFSMVDLAEDAAELIEQQGWSGAVVFGVSMGGMVAQELALRRPDLVRHLVLGCTRAYGGTFGRPGDPVTQRLSAAYVHGDPDASRRNLFALAFGRAYADGAGAWDTYVAMTCLPVAPETSVRQVAAISGFDARDRLAELEVPCLVLHGDEDQMVPYAEGVDVARRVPRPRFETVTGAGHFFWVERPSWTADSLRRFAAERPQPARTKNASRIV
jgi:pimeloyl-ACP methyl ester carboxylesterase